MNNSTSVEARLGRLERSATRWRGLTLALIGVGLAAALIGAGQESVNGSIQPEKFGVAVESGGFAVVEDAGGTWNVIFRAGSGVYKRQIPGN